METRLSPPSQLVNPRNSQSSGVPAESDDSSFDVDRSELLELYRSIPPPELRTHTLSLARDRVIGNVVRKVKDDGIFDNFRKTWMKDLETKVMIMIDQPTYLNVFLQPKFQNLIRRVEIRCGEFLANVKWTPDINKTTLRERLQHFIEGLSFVDIGIRDLLQEVNTGVYANPIPFQRFDDAVTRIVSDMVQNCVQSSTPEFPTLRKATSEGIDDFAGPFSAECSPENQDLPSSRPSSSLLEQAALIRRRTSLSKSPSIETVDMEISSPESAGANGTEESNLSVGLNKESASQRETSADKTDDRVIAKTEILVDTNDDRVQGALGLLLLASGNDWNNDYVDDVPEGTELQGVVEKTETEEKSTVINTLATESLPSRGMPASVSEVRSVDDLMPTAIQTIPPVDAQESNTTLQEPVQQLKKEQSSVQEYEGSSASSSQDERKSSQSDVSQIISVSTPVGEWISDGVLATLAEPSEVKEVLSEPAQQIESREQAKTTESGNTSESSVRPTRQRKSNSRYCNDAFVTVPPLPKRGAKRSRVGTQSLYDEAASSPASSGGQNEPTLVAAEGRPSGKRRRKT